MIRAIIFDFGGVLLKRKIGRDLITILANVISQSPDVIKPLWEKHHSNLLTGNITTKEFVRILANELNYPDDSNKIYSEWANKAGITKRSINCSLLNLIRTLRQKYKVYVLSNMIDLAEKDKALTPLKKNFNEYFTSYRLGSRKPQPEIFRKLLAKINLRSDECIFIDDDEKNITASASLGFHSIQYENVRKLKTILSRRHFLPIRHRVGEFRGSVEDQEALNFICN